MRDLPKPKLKKLAKTLDDMLGAFDEEIHKLAEQARSEILPYFKAHDYDYAAGNGQWFISKPSSVGAPYYREDDYVAHDDLPANIRELLMLDVGLTNACLGYYIRDIKRGEW